MSPLIVNAEDDELPPSSWGAVSRFMLKRCAALRVGKMWTASGGMTSAGRMGSLGSIGRVSSNPVGRSPPPSVEGVFAVVTGICDRARAVAFVCDVQAALSTAEDPEVTLRVRSNAGSAPRRSTSSASANAWSSHCRTTRVSCRGSSCWNAGESKRNCVVGAAVTANDSSAFASV